jgi:hypothetical protein
VLNDDGEDSDVQAAGDSALSEPVEITLPRTTADNKQTRTEARPDDVCISALSEEV